MMQNMIPLQITNKVLILPLTITNNLLINNTVASETIAV